MPKSEGQKLKLLYLADLLRRETDEDHALSMSDILSRLEELGVHAERKASTMISVRWRITAWISSPPAAERVATSLPTGSSSCRS